jgi:hypothetical protein
MDKIKENQGLTEKVMERKLKEGRKERDVQRMTHGRKGKRKNYANEREKV